MKIHLSKSGEGKISGGGTYNIGDTVTLLAEPRESVTFGYWLEGIEPEPGEFDKRIKHTDNPYIFTVETNEDKYILAYLYQTMYDYLQSLIEFELPERSFVTVANRYEFSLDDDSNYVEQRDKDLALADLLLVLTTSPSTIQGKTEKAGNWSITDTSTTISITDKQRLEKRAYALYKRWGIDYNLDIPARIFRRMI